MVVPHACMPGAKFMKFGVAALQVEPTGWLASNLITTELGLTPVSVLLVRSSLTESEFRPFGVTRQEQHEINCSSGENA